MEFLIAFALVLVILLLVGVNFFDIGLLLLGLLDLLCLAMFCFFAFSLFRLFTCKRVKARFKEIAENEKSRFKVAWYVIDGKEEALCFLPNFWASGCFINARKIQMYCLPKRAAFLTLMQYLQ